VRVEKSDAKSCIIFTELEEGDKGVFEILRKRGQWRRGK
jgi:hypothetical protein